MLHESLAARMAARVGAPAGLFTAALIVASLSSIQASAQTLGGSGDATLGVERVFGFYGVSAEADTPGGGTDLDASGAGVGFHEPVSMFAVPRVAFDYFIIDSLSLGGSLGFFSNDYDSGGGQDSGFILAPRVGYAVPFNAEWGIWPRGGISYYSVDDPDRNQVAFSAELPLYYMPMANVGFFTNLLFDFGLSGEIDLGPTDYDYSESLFGLGFGLFARF